MKKIVTMCAASLVIMAAGTAMADTFGTGGNQFAIDFVPISGSTNPTSGYGIVNNDYRMGKFEITNGQWDKFKVAYGTVMGNPSSAYGFDPSWTGTNVPTTNASWYEAAQFTNWLNTSTGHQAAYKFTSTQGQSDYTFTPWAVTDNGYNAGNPYRNSEAFYFLPTEDEWVKAAYWNGTSMQKYATKAGESLTQGNGTSGTGWNYYNNGYATSPFGPWNAGSGSQELNGTYDMMGNAWEFTESPYYSGDYYTSGSGRGLRGGAYYTYSYTFYALESSFRLSCDPSAGNVNLGFRIASIPEPATLFLLGLGAAMIRKLKS